MIKVLNRLIDPGFNYRKKHNIPRDWNVEFEWKPQDAWIGAFWKRTGHTVDLWVCILPCIPLHISWWGKDSQ